MRLVSRIGPVGLALAIACGPRAVSEEPGVPFVVVDRPVPAVVSALEVPKTPELAPLPARPTRRRVRAQAPRLPAPTGLAVTGDDGLPLVFIGPVDWSGPVSLPRPDVAMLRSHLERVNAQEETLAELARMRYELSRALDAIVEVLPVLDRHTRLRAGLRVCALRRELEELEGAGRQLQVDVVAFRELIAPAVRLAELR